MFVACRATRKVSASLLEYVSAQLVQIPIAHIQDVDVGALKQCARWTAHVSELRCMCMCGCGCVCVCVFFFLPVCQYLGFCGMLYLNVSL
jgi:hypothetical protein